MRVPGSGVGAALLAALCLLPAPGVAQAGETPPQATEPAPAPTVQTFRFELDGSVLKRSSWIVLLRSDGTGLYWPTAASKSGEVPLHVSEATWRRVQAGAGAVLANHCETRARNVAKTGSKNVQYQETPEVSASCVFNYSDDAGLNDAAQVMESIAEVMEFGDRLQHELRYDRLGLDAEIDSLADAVKAGRAMEVGNISGVLQAIVDDERVMVRVRRKAARLLGEGSLAIAKP